MRVFCDMDGVLADFVGGASKAHNRPSPYFEGSSCLGKFEMEECWGIGAEEFWAPTNSKEFWLGLEKTPEFEAILLRSAWYFGGENLAILTAPSLFPGCMGAKREWIQKHSPFLGKKVIFASAEAKKFFAHPQALLIDDRDQNVEEWREAGGAAVLVPRLWNKDWGLALEGKTLRVVEERLHGIANTQL